MPSKLSFKTRSSLAELVNAKTKPLIAAAIARAMPKAAVAMKNRLVSASKAKLGASSTVYEKGLKGAVQVTSNTVKISITDKHLLAVERGAKSYDIKKALLAHGKKGKTGGRYVDIPIKKKAGVKSKTDVTFRRLSTNSPASSWTHPGYKGLRLLETRANSLRATARKVVVAELKAAGFNFKVKQS